MEKYHLEIYDHDDFKTALLMFSSNSPFLTISVGDLIDLSGANYGGSQKYFRATGFRHIIFDDSNGNPIHKICAYVTGVGDAKDFLLTGRP